MQFESRRVMFLYRKFWVPSVRQMRGVDIRETNVRHAVGGKSTHKGYMLFN